MATKYRVLVVDHWLYHGKWREILAGLDCEVVSTAISGDQGLAYMVVHRPDFVVCDWALQHAGDREVECGSEWDPVVRNARVPVVLLVRGLDAELANMIKETYGKLIHPVHRNSLEDIISTIQQVIQSIAAKVTQEA